MGTTAIFAEILVIGLEALVWIGLTVAALFGPEALTAGGLADNESLTLLLVAAAAYVLGVVVDRAADSTMLWLEPKIDCRFERYRSRRVAHVNTMRIALMSPELGVAPFLEYQRSRVRVARGTVFNLFFVILAADFFLLARAQLAPSERWLLLIGINLGGALLLVGAYDVFRRILNAWLKMLDKAYRMLVVEGPGRGKRRGGADVAPAGTGAGAGAGADEGRTIVAGVVHRQRRARVEFLLVRTKDGCRWTFPKGHVKAGESAQQAVAREIDEEAGVEGAVAPEALATYRYPSTRKGDVDDSQVTAYLVRFAERREALERRGSGWFPAELAKERLATDRAEVHAREAAAVIDAAVDAIARTPQ